MTANPSDAPYARLEWGHRGASAAGSRGDIIVIVDVLSFSTACAVAASCGAGIYPATSDEEATALAARHDALLAFSRGEGRLRGGPSLSPVSMLDIQHGARIALRSPNGATCVRLAADAGAAEVLVGSLPNASATAAAVHQLLAERPASAITVVACGERWVDGHPDGSLRFALEDLLGAGAILAGLPGPKSPDARAAEAVFSGLRGDLLAVILDSPSGRELIDTGYEGDVRFAAQLDVFGVAVRLRSGLLAPMLLSM